MFHTVIALDIAMKEGMQPGYYAQIIKKLADTEALVDRDRTMLFVKPEGRDTVTAVLDHYGVTYEDSEWLQLGNVEDGWTPTRLWSDYGIETRSRALFLDLSLGALVSFEPDKPDAEPAQAEAQLDEHAIAILRPAAGGRPVFAIDRQLLELAQGIAKAYHCAVVYNCER
jgi:hypothetical protein